MEFTEYATRKEEMRNFGKRIEEALLAGDNELFTRYLRLIAAARYTYSPANAFLIMFQRPTSRMVLSKTRAHKLAAEQGHKGIKKTGKYGPYIEHVYMAQGSKAAYVWCPRTFTKKEIDPKTGEEKDVTGVYFVPGDVWAIEDLRYLDTKEPVECPDFVTDLGDTEDLYSALCAVAVDHGLNPKEEAIGGGYRGYTLRQDVVVDVRDETGKKTMVMAHELAHGVLEHQKKHDELPKGLREAEAELSAAVILARFGYDVVSASASYLRLHDVSAADVMASLKRIHETALSVADEVQAKLDTQVSQVA